MDFSPRSKQQNCKSNCLITLFGVKKIWRKFLWKIQNLVSVRFRYLTLLPVSSSLTQVCGLSVATSLLSVLNLFDTLIFRKLYMPLEGFHFTAHQVQEITW